MFGYISFLSILVVFNHNYSDSQSIVISKQHRSETKNNPQAKGEMKRYRKKMTKRAEAEDNT